MMVLAFLEGLRSLFISTDDEIRRSSQLRTLLKLVVVNRT